MRNKKNEGSPQLRCTYQLKSVRIKECTYNKLCIQDPITILSIVFIYGVKWYY